MPLIKKARSIFSGIDVSLWFSFGLIVLGFFLSFYYGTNLERTTTYTLNDQAVILRSLHEIEKMEVLIRSHFAINDAKFEKDNFTEIKNIKIQIEVLFKQLATRQYLPRFKILKRKWEREIIPILDAIMTLNKEDIDYKNLKVFIANYKSLAIEILGDNNEVKSVEIQKLKYIRLFAVISAFFAVLIILRKMAMFKLEMIKANDYFERLTKNQKKEKINFKQKSIQDLKRNIDRQFESIQILEEQKQDFLNMMKETFIICRPDFSVQYCSKEIKRLLGWESFELENKKFSNLLASESYFEDLELKYYQNGKKLFNVSLDCLNNRGDHCPIKATFVDYYDKIHQQNIILIVLKDGSYLQQIEELTEKSKYLFHNSKMASLGEMSSSIAYEINNPLMIIKGSAGRLQKLLIREGIYDEQMERILDRISRMSERISSVIYVMQSFGERSDKTAKKFISVSELVMSALELNTEKLKQKGINIEYSINDPNILVKVNKTDMDQAILSIINNAYDAIDTSKIREGLVSIKVFNEGERLFILIRNNGEAIAKDVGNRIFDPFFSTKEGGVGMGLSIAHTLCQRNEVDLKLDSLYPVTFRLEFLGLKKLN